jgi:hypothetical protein
MRRAVLLFLVALPAIAATGSARYNRETITIASAACPTGAPGLDSDGDPWGISLYDLRGFKVRVCPASGETITGAGTLKVCTYSPSPYGDGTWALSPELSWDMTGKSSIGSSNPCLEFTHLQTVVSLPGERVFVYPSTDFGVSGGTTVRIYLSGESR